MPETTLRRRLWEALIALALEESVRVFMPVLLPYVWLAILLGLTGEILNSDRIRAKSKTVSERIPTNRKVLFKLSKIALGSALILFYWWGIQKVHSALIAATAPEDFQVIFKTAFINMNKKLDNDHFFWMLYPGAYGDTISPVALLVFLQMHSSYRRSVQISSYSVAIKSDNCGWVNLTPMDFRGRTLVWGRGTLNSAPVVRSDTGFNILWAKPIARDETQFGMLAFDAKVSCALQKGSLVQFRIELTESDNHTSSYSSPEMLVRDDFNPPGSNSIAQENVAKIVFTGFAANISDAHRMLFSEPPPKTPVPDREKGVASIFSWKTGQIILEDGIFVETPMPHLALSR